MAFWQRGVTWRVRQRVLSCDAFCSILLHLAEENGQLKERIAFMQSAAEQLEEV